MTDPDGYCSFIKRGKNKTTLKERQEMWHDTKPSGMRQTLRDEIVQLATVWVKEKQAKEEEARKKREAEQQVEGTAAAGPAGGVKKVDAEVIESSDDEVDIVETKLAPVPPKPTLKTKGKGVKVWDASASAQGSEGNLPQKTPARRLR
jgi:hypothetical protein